MLWISLRFLTSATASTTSAPISAEHQGQKSACLVNTVFQLTAEPIRVAVSVSKQNQTHDTILNKGSVAVTVVGTEAETANLGLLGYRTGREVEKRWKRRWIWTPTRCLSAR